MNYKLYSSLIVAILMASCSNPSQNSQNDIETPVSVLELKKGSISKLINTTGTAQATNSVTLNSEMAGLYKLQNNPNTGRPFKLGDAVRKGQLVVRLEDEEYVNGIALDSKELSLEIAEQEQTKQKALYEKGGVTLSQMRNTDVTVTNARHDVENAKINLEKMNIRAPFDGVIVDLPHYTPNVRVEQNKIILGVMAYSNMYMDINMPESAIGYIKPNQPVYITHYTLPDDTLKGTITEISPAISTETRTFKGKIIIENSKLKLRPGMFVKADIVVDKAEKSIIIPKDVIMSNRGNRKYVFIVEKNAAVMRNIKTGLEDEDNIEITDGLKEDDNLVIRGYETLRNGSKVKVIK